MVGPLLEIKTRPPDRRPGAVARPRLVERVGRPARLTLVSAPAGFGKTTLLTQALAAVRSLAWVSVDDRDAEPVRFWTYVLTARARGRPPSACCRRSTPRSPPC